MCTTSGSAFITVNVLTAFWASNEMCLKGWSLYTCCTDPTADQGARGQSQSPGMTRPAFLRHPFAASNFTSSSPKADPAPSRGQLRRRIPPTLPPHTSQPSVRSHWVNQRLFIAGTMSCLGSQPCLAPSVPGLWRRNSSAKVGSHCPAAPSRPHGPDKVLRTDPSYCSLDVREEACLQLLLFCLIELIYSGQTKWHQGYCYFFRLCSIKSTENGN